MHIQQVTSQQKKAYLGLGLQYQLGLWIQERWTLFFLLRNDFMMGS